MVQQKAIETLPLNGRNPLSLLLLEPGVTQRSAGATGSGVHVNGSRDRAFNVTIDGIEANESSVPNPVSNLYRLTPDNVQEYKVTTNNATAEEGSQQRRLNICRYAKRHQRIPWTGYLLTERRVQLE